jgi:hypothetical protein
MGLFDLISPGEIALAIIAGGIVVMLEVFKNMYFEDNNDFVTY